MFISVSLLFIRIDNTILNMTLPSISRSLGASAAELQKMIVAYILKFKALLLKMGSLRNRLGRKRALRLGSERFNDQKRYVLRATSKPAPNRPVNCPRW